MGLLKDMKELEETEASMRQQVKDVIKNLPDMLPGQVLLKGGCFTVPFKSISPGSLLPFHYSLANQKKRLLQKVDSVTIKNLVPMLQTLQSLKGDKFHPEFIKSFEEQLIKVL